MKMKPNLYISVLKRGLDRRRRMAEIRQTLVDLIMFSRSYLEHQDDQALSTLCASILDTGILDNLDIPVRHVTPAAAPQSYYAVRTHLVSMALNYVIHIEDQNLRAILREVLLQFMNTTQIVAPMEPIPPASVPLSNDSDSDWPPEPSR